MSKNERIIQFLPGEKVLVVNLSTGVKKIKKFSGKKWRGYPYSIKNPHQCEYCNLLASTYLRTHGHKQKRHVRARMKLHLKTVHKNPVSANTIRTMKLAHRLAIGIIKATRNYKIPLPLPKRTPPELRRYVQLILDANDIKWKV